MNKEICLKSALDLAALIRRKTISPVEVTQALLDRINATDHNYRAFITVCAEQAIDEARAAERAVMRGSATGALAGVPFAVKDLLYTAGVRTTAGSEIYKDFVPDRDAIAVERMRRAGAILLGKTSTPEFGFKSTTENSLVGTTNNPWALDHTAGGSSGGAAVAVATGMAPLSIGTDAGGSIRTPASFCGIFGFKPTFGRVPSGPGFGGGASISHTGPMTRTVADAALMLDVLAGVDQRERLSVGSPDHHFGRALKQIPTSFRVAYSSDLGYAAVDDAVSSAVMAAVTEMSSGPWQVETSALKLDDPETAFNTLIRAENAVYAKNLLAQHGDQLDPDYRQFTERGQHLSAADYLEALALRQELAATLAGVFEHCDLLITPTLAVPPFLHGQRPQQVAGKPISGMNWLSFTYPFNMTGNPAASVPIGTSKHGLPIGMQIIGPRFADATVLQAAAAVESALPWQPTYHKLFD